MSTVAAPSRNRIAVASFIGTAIEFYDFYIYGTAAALVFGKLFFPSFSATAGTLLSLATFAVGFIARRWARSCSATSATGWAASGCSSPRCW